MEPISKAEAELNQKHPKRGVDGCNSFSHLLPMVHFRKYGSAVATVLFAMAMAVPLLNKPPFWDVMARLMEIYCTLLLSGIQLIAARKSSFRK